MGISLKSKDQRAYNNIHFLALFSKFDKQILCNKRSIHAWRRRWGLISQFPVGFRFLDLLIPLVIHS